MRWRTPALWLTRAGLAACAAVTCVALFLPAPSRMSNPTSEAAVRGAWDAGSKLGRAADRWLPDVLEPLMDDKVLHFGLFLGLGVLLGGELTLRGRWTRRSAVFLTLGLALYAGAGELLQHALGRYGEWGDWIANLMGIAAAVAAVFSAHWIWDSVRRGRHVAAALAENESLGG